MPFLTRLFDYFTVNFWLQNFDWFTVKIVAHIFQLWPDGIAISDVKSRVSWNTIAIPKSVIKLRHNDDGPRRKDLIFFFSSPNRFFSL